MTRPPPRVIAALHNRATQQAIDELKAIAAGDYTLDQHKRALRLATELLENQCDLIALITTPVDGPDASGGQA